MPLKVEGTFRHCLAGLRQKYVLRKVVMFTAKLQKQGAIHEAGGP